MPAGTYDLVITAGGRVNAVMTGVPVDNASATVIGSDAARINTPLSAASYIASGAVSVRGDAFAFSSAGLRLAVASIARDQLAPTNPA